MATWTTPPTWTVGEDITAVDLQAMSDDLTYLSDLIGGASTNSVATSQTTTSTTYVDLATVGPTVTLTTRTLALVIVTAFLENSAGTNDSRMSFAISGATTLAASDLTALRHVGTSGARMSTVALVALTAGSNVFTAKYKVSGGTGTFVNRDLIVVPL